MVPHVYNPLRKGGPGIVKPHMLGFMMVDESLFDLWIT
jgi:hypothetical protein